MSRRVATCGRRRCHRTTLDMESVAVEPNLARSANPRTNSRADHGMITAASLANVMEQRSDQQLVQRTELLGEVATPRLGTVSTGHGQQFGHGPPLVIVDRMLVKRRALRHGMGGGQFREHPLHPSKMHETIGELASPLVSGNQSDEGGSIVPRPFRTGGSTQLQLLGTVEQAAGRPIEHGVDDRHSSDIVCCNVTAPERSDQPSSRRPDRIGDLLHEIGPAIVHHVLDGADSLIEVSSDVVLGFPEPPRHTRPEIEDVAVDRLAGRGMERVADGEQHPTVVLLFVRTLRDDGPEAAAHRSLPAQRVEASKSPPAGLRVGGEEMEGFGVPSLPFVPLQAGHHPVSLTA